MSLSLTPGLLAVVCVVVVVAGAVNGVAGFGFSLVGTMALATVVDPATAVVFMIVPILAVNLSLVRELSVAELRSCGTRFGPLKVGLGVLTLAFVVSAQNRVPVPGLDRAREGCFVESTPAMVFLGLNGVRVGAAAAVPAAAGVAVGTRVRGYVDQQRRRRAVLSLLAVIGLRLILGRLGVA
jgi:uncharacterized membrane protein YfcA